MFISPLVLHILFTQSCSLPLKPNAVIIRQCAFWYLLYICQISSIPVSNCRRNTNYKRHQYSPVAILYCMTEFMAFYRFIITFITHEKESQFLTTPPFAHSKINTVSKSVRLVSCGNQYDCHN